MRIGMFDSGIGGLNVLKEVMKKYKETEYIYYGDTYYLPYGEKTKEELIALASRIILFFEEENVDMIVIACGTCSSLVENLKTITKIPIYDVITPTVKYIKNRFEKVALLATSSTIQNGIFERKLKEQNIEVYPLSCPHFVPYLEGLTESLDVEEELNSLKNNSFETVILGCTHFPLLKKQIENCLQVPSIDMGVCLTETIKIEENSHFALTIYMSKVTEELKRNVNHIFKKEMLIIEKNLPV